MHKSGANEKMKKAVVRCDACNVNLCRFVPRITAPRARNHIPVDHALAFCCQVVPASQPSTNRTLRENGNESATRNSFRQH
jgi:hypothetical protein